MLDYVTLGASSFGNLLTRKNTIRAGEGTIGAGEEQSEQDNIFNNASFFNKF